MIGAAISTTSDPHRLGLLRLSVEHWRMALPVGSPLFVTVAGDEDAYRRAVAAVGGLAATVVRVGQPGITWASHPSSGPFGVRDGRLGVAANKNTGIECLMDWCGDSPFPPVEDIFLSDDDSWPISPDALTEHTDLSLPHTMVCWGMHRQQQVCGDWASWKWPRGSVLHVQRGVIVKCGGMREEFGPGGHEHVEWSRRIHQTLSTPAPFMTPARYASERAMWARRLWHCEDMQQKGEPLGNARIRRRRLTSVRRAPGDWEHIERIMNEVDGDTSFVPFRAAGNGRLSATMTTTSPA